MMQQRAYCCNIAIDDMLVGDGKDRPEVRKHQSCEQKSANLAFLEAVTCIDTNHFLTYNSNTFDFRFRPQQLRSSTSLQSLLHFTYSTYTFSNIDVLKVTSSSCMTDKFEYFESSPSFLLYLDFDFDTFQQNVYFVSYQNSR
jgi:hypothetical protein